MHDLEHIVFQNVTFVNNVSITHTMLVLFSFQHEPLNVHIFESTFSQNIGGPLISVNAESAPSSPWSYSEVSIINYKINGLTVNVQ